MPSSDGVSPLKSSLLEILEKGGTAMTAEFIVAVITCVVTVINTVIVILSYLKK